MTTSVSPWTRDLTSNQAPNPVPSFSSAFFCHSCFHLRTSAHAVPVSVVLPPLSSCLRVGSFYPAGVCGTCTERTTPGHMIWRVPPLFSVIALYLFSSQHLSQCVMMYWLVCFVIICPLHQSVCSMRTGDLSISFTIAVPASRAMLGP